MKRSSPPLLKILVACLLAAQTALAGPYTDDGIEATVGGEVNPVFSGWATGYLNYVPAPASDPALDGRYTYGGGVSDGTGGGINYRTPENTIGAADQAIVSLGDLSPDQITAGVNPGEITLTFDQTIIDGNGYDFAVFENAFASGGGVLAELGFVAVSSDGLNFARFDSVSLTPGTVGPYDTIDPTDVHNLAGKHLNNYGTCVGTGFDLSDLLDDPLVTGGLVDLNDINYIKVVDIPGNGDYLDAVGNSIYDAYETWGSGGVDLDAVGVINVVPIPGGVWLLGSCLLAVFGLRKRHG